MSTPEQNAWSSLRPVLLGIGLDPRRVENVVGDGHPDVDYAGGNIELKAMSDWPKRSSTPVKVPEFTGQQAGWLGQRWKSQGLSWLMVKLDKSWFLFDGWTALRHIYPGATQEEWHSLATFVYPGTFKGGRGWGTSPAITPGAHPYSKQLRDWLRYDLDRMQPHSRARAMRLRSFVGHERVTEEAVAKALGWPTEQVCRVEHGGGTASETDTLLDFWNN